MLQETYAAEAAQSTATAQVRGTILQAETGWQAVFSEPFSNNINEWPTGEEDGGLTTISWNVREGKYIWEARAHDSFIYWTRPEIQPLRDFHIDVETRQVSGAADGQSGLIFRQSDSQNYYLFRISHDQYYALHRSTPDDWVTIIDWTPSNVINPSESNRVSVTVVDAMILLFVNDQLLGEAYDDRLQSGRAGLAIGLSNPGDQIAIEFDNFEIRAPNQPRDVPEKPQE